MSKQAKTANDTELARRRACAQRTASEIGAGLGHITWGFTVIVLMFGLAHTLGLSIGI
jgi:hypothetical protein